jgi:hypothetical protein
MGRFHRGRNQWQERNVATDRRRHRWPVASSGATIGFVELQENASLPSLAPVTASANSAR